VTSLFASEKGRIRTTLHKAKETRPVAEKMITLARRDTLHARRQVLAFVSDQAVVGKLFSDIAPRYAERPGGYTRILRTGRRQGDAAEMALLELVGAEDAAEAKSDDKKDKKAAKK
jgi:large subunit ribosomal protein L17